jgi:hypothetical protein
MNLREPAMAAFSGLALLSIVPAFVVSGRSSASTRASAFVVQFSAQAALLFRLGAPWLAGALFGLGALALALVYRRRDDPPEADAGEPRESSFFLTLFALGVAGKVAYDHPWRVAGTLTPTMGHHVALVFALSAAALLVLRSRGRGMALAFASVTFAAAVLLVVALARRLEPAPVFGRTVIVVGLGCIALQVLASKLLFLRGASSTTDLAEGPIRERERGP